MSEAPRGPALGTARRSPRRLGVILVDPLPVVRAGTRLLIDDRPDMEVLAEAGDADQAVEAITRVRRTRVVVLVGLGLAGEHDAYWLIRTLRQRYPTHAILGSARTPTPHRSAGRCSWAPTASSTRTSTPWSSCRRSAVRPTARWCWRSRASSVVGQIVEGIERRREVEVKLTDREREVLVVAAEGLTARQIATRLGVRERTITTHLARIYGKLGVGSRLAAIRMASQSGLVSVGASE